MSEYQPFETLRNMLKAGKFKTAQDVDEVLAAARQALARHAWDDDKDAVWQYERDICLLLDMQRYEREVAAAEVLVSRLPEIVVRTVQ